MELIPILTRAESLFRRFERTVEAIDKKNNFPAPAAHQRKQIQNSTTDKGKSPEAVASSSSVNPELTVPTPWKENDSRVISPELRELLSKEVHPVHESTSDETH